MGDHHFWIHCNVCTTQYSQQVKLYLLSCQHILCRICMKNFTKKGTTCPMDKKSIKYMELSKLTESQKHYFKPNIPQTLEEFRKKIRFQQTHQMHLFKSTVNWKLKYEKMLDIKNKIKERVFRKKQMLDDMIKRRKLMQEKLKQIYIKQQQQVRRQAYRDSGVDVNSSFSQSTATRSSNPNSFNNSYGKLTASTPTTAASQSNKNYGSNFFDSFKKPSQPASRAQRTQYTQQRSQQHRTQSDRSPLF